MRGILETTAIVGLVIMLAATILVCVMSASVLAVGRTSAIDAVGSYGSNDNLSAESRCFGPMGSSAPCP
jgi:hypothetical protein